MKKNYKANIIILMLVSILVLYFVLKDDFGSITKTILNVNPYWLIVALLLMVISWFFASLCLYTLAKNIEKDFKIWDYFKSIIITNFFGSITPYGVGGQPFQIYHLNKRGMKLHNATNIIIEFFKLHQITVVILGFLAVFLNNRYNFFPDNNLLVNLVILGFALNIGVIVVLTFLSRGTRISGNIAKKIINLLHKIKIVKKKDAAFEKIDNYIHDSHESMMYYRSHRGELIQAAIYNFISLCCLYVIPLFVAFSLNSFNDLNVVTTIAGSAYVMVVGALVPVPGGTGGLEFGFAHFFGFFLKGPVLMAVLLMWRFVTYYFGIIVGGILFVLFSKKEGFR